MSFVSVLKYIDLVFMGPHCIMVYVPTGNFQYMKLRKPMWMNSINLSSWFTPLLASPGDDFITHDSL